ncbi:outer membrane usher protein [Erwinia tasmaniensis]|uniref:Outer membrane platform usher (Mannose-resistance fimbriae), MrfC protein n=1 Tax=Erwinia tasmaniensis (strain DSM 17950 / CFBP 7177 / CIP 109463 / NCPPB 4357 / Et1/99) TaxID=465817 RepID=B2VL18_ERWT9|nr:outer membrane usher protein [Erwinia tasmaniensis]CAO95449.1 Outer membrane platform usher (mannose-resistance fimbriae), MrfC protein [Erwinia tasmaniensis Et1/99]
MNVYRYFAVRPLSALLALAALVNLPALAVETIEFNTDVLDVKDRSKIDLSDFSRADYLMPGQYQMVVRINKNELREQNITFMPPEDDPKGSIPCLTPEIVKQLGFTAAAMRELRWWNNAQCLRLDSLKGMTARGDLGSASLYINVPQAYLEYVADNWDPPSRWDNGISALVFDYNLNAQSTHQSKGHETQTLSGNGTTGFNLGAWRFRADWQGGYDHSTGKDEGSNNNWDMSRYYAYRAIASLRAKLMMGESYLNSTIFDSFRFLGASLVSDDNMLPPNLRGYAPEVSGVAKTNAKVTVSQQGRVLYETTVSSGPFRIQDLNSATTGTLDVKIQEQDGTSRTFQVSTANVPYLTRPGQLRYKLALGKPSDLKHNTQGPGFAASELSWGINNGWSLYGGSVLAGDYNSAALGVGRDLLSFGALAFDVTQSRANLPQQGTLSGRSFRLSYSKRFDEYDSQVTFAGYRFSERDYLSMTQYLDTRYHGNNYGSSKELYTVTFNKQFPDIGISSYINYSHRTYWDRPANDNYNLSLSRYFNVGRVHNVSVNLSAYRNSYNNRDDDGMFLSLTVPWGNTASLTYDGQFNSSGSSNMVGYYDRIDDNNSYNVKTGVAQQGRGAASGYFTHDGDMAQMTANASYESGRYSSVGLGLQGGLTATPQGAAAHRINAMGGTRMMVDTDGVSDVPIRGYGGLSHSNHFGKAVVSDVNSYYRNSISVDVNALPDNVDATRSVVQGTLTEGAVGYRRFGVISGEKAMASLRLADGSSPPFGATVVNQNHYQTGIVGDNGSAWLTGIKPGETMRVRWNGKTQCVISLPSPLPPLTSNLLLPCRAAGNDLAKDDAVEKENGL